MYIILLWFFLPGNFAASCPPNSHYESCASNSQLTCTNTLYNPTNKTNCVSACVCNDGFIKDEKKNVCVLPHQCQEIGRCGRNEEFNSCVKCGGFGGQLTCSTYGSPVYFFWCPPTCSAKCVCKKNYVFDDVTRKCVLPKQCTCTGGRIFLICPNPYASDPNCGCRCRNGFMFDYELNRCVRSSDLQSLLP